MANGSLTISNQLPVWRGGAHARVEGERSPWLQRPGQSYSSFWSLYSGNRRDSSVKVKGRGDLTVPGRNLRHSDHFDHIFSLCL